MKEFSDILNQENTEIEGEISEVFPDFFEQLPNKYQYLNNDPYKNIRVSIGDNYLDITNNAGDAIGGINLYKQGDTYYIIKNLII